MTLRSAASIAVVACSMACSSSDVNEPDNPSNDAAPPTGGISDIEFRLLDYACDFRIRNQLRE